MFSLLGEIGKDGLLAVVVILVSTAYVVSYWKKRRNWSLIGSLCLYIALSVTVVLYTHPGTNKPYVYYVVGWIAKYGEVTVPTRPVHWGRTELPIIKHAKPLPNVILIVADDLGYNDLSGGAGVATPRIDSIRDQGVMFSQAYSGHATCSPARAALLTGRFPSRFGYEYTAVHWLFAWALTRPSKSIARQPIFHSELLKSMPKESDMSLPSSETMISNVLKTANYSTVYVGKWHLGESKPALPQNRGFDETLVFLRGGSKYLPTEHPDVVNAYLGDSMDDFLFDNLGGNVRHNGTARMPPGEYITDYFGRNAANAIRTKLARPENKSKTVPPLFLTVAYNCPHTPLQALRTDYASPELAHLKHKERVYAAMIKSMDRSVGMILDALEETGQKDNTLVIFTSDNGGPAYVGIDDMNKPLRGWKATFFEGGFRVPLFMRWPKVFRSGIEYDGLVSHVDIFGTVAAAARVDTSSLRESKTIDGVDLVPYILNKRADSSSPHHSLFWRTGTYIAYREGTWKLQVSQSPDRVWLTDMSRDQRERHNLAGQLTWSRLHSILTETTDDSACFPRLLEELRNNSKVHGQPDQAKLTAALCKVSRNLLTVNAAQAEPLWPGLAEVAIPVDTAAMDVVSVDEEYVYWTN
jgi:arylsulfatase A-like enzyme